MRIQLALAALLLGLAAPSVAQDLSPVPGRSAPARLAAGNGGPGLAWTWSPEPRWLDGAPVSRRTFFGGLDFGPDFYGSTVAARDIPPVLIVFDTSIETLGRSFQFVTNLPDRGLGRFRGAAYDMSNPSTPRRLNVGFFEDARYGTPDLEWGPDGSTYGKIEYLIVFSSDYDGTGETYAGQSAYDLDTYYGLSSRVRDGHTLYETTAEMMLTPAALRDVVVVAPDNGELAVTWVAAALAGGTEVRLVSNGAVLGSADPAAESILLTGLDPEQEITIEVQLRDGSGVLAVQTVTAQPLRSRSVSLVANLDPGRAGSSTYGDTWGYTAPDGTEYALLAGRGTGLSVIDISAAPASAPVEVGFVARAGSDAKDVKVYGHYAYLVNEIGPIQIIDLSDPTAPVQVGLLDVQPDVSSGGSHNVLVAEDHLWVTGGRTNGNAGVRVYSLADPVAPAFVGAFSPTHQSVAYYHDFEVRDGIGYGPAIYDGGGVDVLDVSDPSDIRLITTFTYPGAGAHNTCTTEDGTTIYVGDEIGTSGNWTRIFDIRDVENAEFVGEIVIDGAAVVHNCYVRGDRLYVAHYTEGLRVFDITDPHAPVETAFFDTYLPARYGYNGAWTAYPYFASGKVIVSDLQSGLWVFTLDESTVAAEPVPTAPTALRVFPNPTAGGATLAYTLATPGRVEVVVTDALGREIVRQAGSDAPGVQRTTLDTAGWPAGLYIARLVVDGRPRGAATLTVTR